MAETSGGLQLLLAILLINSAYSQLPDQRLCGDEECKGEIRLEVFLLRFELCVCPFDPLLCDEITHAGDRWEWWD